MDLISNEGEFVVMNVSVRVRRREGEENNK